MVDDWAHWLEAHVVSSWETNLVAIANRPAPERTDAAGDWIDQHMRGADNWANAPEAAMREVASRVNQRNLQETKGLIRSYDAEGKYQGRVPKGPAPVNGLHRVSLKDIVDPASIKGFQSRNAELIKGLRKRTNTRVRETLEKAQENGWPIDRLRKHLANELGIASSKADLIARDQVLKLNGDIAEERQRQAGIETYQWSTSGDEKVRDMHAELDGTIQSWDDPPVTDAYGNTNHPGQDIACRCVAIPILPELL